MLMIVIAVNEWIDRSYFTGKKYKHSGAGWVSGAAAMGPCKVDIILLKNPLGTHIADYVDLYTVDQ